MNPFNDNNEEINSSLNLLNWFENNNSIEYSDTFDDDQSLFTNTFFRPFRHMRGNNNEAPPERRRSRDFHLLSSPRIQRIPRLQPRYQLIERISSRCWDNKLIQKKYGSFFIELLQKMVSRELIYVNEPCNFYKKFFFIFYTQFKKGNKEILSQIIKCFPDIYTIKAFIQGGEFNRKTSIRNILFIKICLDILDAYYNKVDSLILNQIYFNDYLQLFIMFYTNISNRNMLSVINKLQGINSNFYVQYKRFVEFDRDEFIQYYNREEREKSNLYGGMKIKSNLFVQ